ncbi:DUF4956 domain-containing protein [Arcticibacterium luteifluviistationis]|uniref:DUF4956 domain-containing protein n=1 Tax=Arcticibacterium luteifluviistationis TaxID=1784714 RepID=A0A2Z4GH95_9BACT|nr:DUF4956 domain-containing protein [Arcticibacterium luteifluviistationis]AWW00184.1 DUF4956 domain-containing protein [Arcticibacterium luteifluviistationis]
MEFLDIPLFDDDFFKMMFRFIINIFFLSIIIRGLYFKSSERKEYLFTYYMIAIIVFFLCFTLKKYELDIGMALGLFAIFGIIRYRTDAIPIKEMTYLFIVIGVSVINSLANQKMSYAEILAGNILIVGAIYIMERLWRVNNEESKTIVYEKIENVKPQNYHLLKEDLEERTGLSISDIQIDAIDFLKDTAQVTILFNKIK